MRRQACNGGEAATGGPIWRPSTTSGCWTVTAGGKALQITADMPSANPGPAGL